MTGIYEIKFLRFGFFACNYCFWNICKGFYACAEGGFKGNVSVVRSSVFGFIIVIFRNVIVRIFGQFYKYFFFLFWGAKLYKRNSKIFPIQFGRQNLGNYSQNKNSKNVVYVGKEIKYCWDNINNSTEYSNTDIDADGIQNTFIDEPIIVIILKYKWIHYYNNNQNYIYQLMKGDKKHLEIITFCQREIVFYCIQIYLFTWVGVSSNYNEPKNVVYICKERSLSKNYIGISGTSGKCPNHKAKKAIYWYECPYYDGNKSSKIGKQRSIPQKINNNYANDNALIFAFGQGGIAA